MKDPTPDAPADVATVVPDVAEADTLGALSAQPPATSVSDPDADEPLAVRGGRYEGRELLGRGGMGEVFLCTDPVIGREVAMKQIREGVEHDAAARRRFLREARVQGQLEHPAIVPVYELSRAHDGRTYFTMKRVKGESLLQILRRMRSGTAKPADTRRRLLNAFAQVCLAVDFAHERGVIHRDLKPANIMLGGYGEVYVLDWGLAKIEDAPELDELSLPSSRDDETQVGAVLGTPGYASPEQLRQQATRASDVYALGAVLFEALTLEKLHAGDSGAALVAATIDGADARISRRYPDLDVPPELEAICLRATATDPGDRFHSARALHASLTAFLDGDQNLELRRVAASELAEHAQGLGARALEGDEEARGMALQAIGRALGLDPSNRDAIATMVDLLEHPPKELPPEADTEIDALHQEHMRLAARDGAIGFISWVFYVPLLLLMGLRDGMSLAISTVLMVAAAGVSWWAARQDRYVRSHSLLVILVGTLALSSMTRLFGPYLLLPTILMGQAVAFSLSPYRRERLVAAAMSALGILGPVVLEALGWIPAQTVFAQDSIQILPGITGLHPTFTPVVLAVGSLGLIITPVVLIGRARAAWNAAQRENAVRAWHLHQLVAEGDNAKRPQRGDAAP
ncbi:MAG: protein kinase domain-containing protein [Nannocystales bacterium]